MAEVRKWLNPTELKIISLVLELRKI
jgi:hypothetical protein